MNNVITNLDIFPELDKIILKDAQSILDVGCGGSEYDNKIDHDFWNKFDYFKERVGIDIYQKEINWRRKYFPNDVFFIGDVFDIEKWFLDKSFDVVHCQNVIEHLPKERALKLIEKMERIAKRQVILGTPKGFRQVDDLSISKNPFQKHLCDFTEEELKKLGYNVITIGKENVYYLCYKNFEANK